jgi:hypothetical protein
MVNRIKLLLAILLAPVGAVWADNQDRGRDEAVEYWFNQAVSFRLDEDTGLELQTAQRFRREATGRPDTYFARLWLNQTVATNLALSGAVERRINDGASNEIRLTQQLLSQHGLLHTRLRIEQRFVHDADNTGLRLRPRLGVVIPLDQDRRLQARADAEIFVTLRSLADGGDTGLTGLRTQVGMAYELNPRLSLTAVYLRQQDFRDRGPDIVGHVPFMGLRYSL